MGFFDLFLKNRPKPKGEYKGKFEMLNGYEPRFTTWGGSLYESELIRSAINVRATHISKMKDDLQGSSRPAPSPARGRASPARSRRARR